MQISDNKMGEPEYLNYLISMCGTCELSINFSKTQKKAIGKNCLFLHL